MCSHVLLLNQHPVASPQRRVLTNPYNSAASVYAAHIADRDRRTSLSPATQPGPRPSDRRFLRTTAAIALWATCSGLQIQDLKQKNAFSGGGWVTAHLLDTPLALPRTGCGPRLINNRLHTFCYLQSWSAGPGPRRSGNCGEGWARTAIGNTRGHQRSDGSVRSQSQTQAIHG